MARVLLFALLFIAMGAQGEDIPEAELPCFWLGSGFWCGVSDCPIDTTEFMRAAAGKSHYQYAQEFGNDCKLGEKTLCCKNEAIYADPARHCHTFPDSVCPENTTTVFMQRESVWAWSDTMFTGLCCDPIVFGLKKGEN